MNYEEFYAGLKDLEKSLESSTKDGTKASKNIGKNLEDGTLKGVDKELANLESAIAKQQTQLEELKEKINSFNREEYVTSGDFESQLVEECRNKGINVVKKGTLTYEMFPNKVTISADTLDTTVDKKKFSVLRPEKLAENIKNIQDKLTKGSFNESRFLEELEKAYDLAILKKKKFSGDWIAFKDIYNMLVPMGRLRNEYSLQNFAFDIGRLYASDAKLAKDGRRIDYDTSRDNTKGLRIVHASGSEEYFKSMRFTKDEGQE